LNGILDRPTVPADAKPMAKEFISSVFVYMFGALLITGIISWWFADSGYMFSLYNVESGGLNALGYVVMFAPIGLVFAMQLGMQKLSLPVLSFMFIAYSVLLGMSLSFIFHIYSLGTIAVAFFSTAGSFGAMAILGYTTKTDLSKFGSIMYMGFIGIFIAGIANWWIGSSLLGYAISMIGVVVFTGLTAVEMQRLKWMAYDPNLEGVTRKKLALIGGLKLYILFINLFISILSLFGGRD
ncbi:MAG: Bax inhibitor-1/YccA family protein, partial [Flavobacteriales bacterium]|nr:Bax inhibitor-1/YccA family protein [Flavobacteriales bacterium]